MILQTRWCNSFYELINSSKFSVRMMHFDMSLRKFCISFPAPHLTCPNMDFYKGQQDLKSFWGTCGLLYYYNSWKYNVPIYQLMMYLIFQLSRKVNIALKDWNSIINSYDRWEWWNNRLTCRKLRSALTRLVCFQFDALYFLHAFKQFYLWQVTWFSWQLRIEKWKLCPLNGILSVESFKTVLIAFVSYILYAKILGKIMNTMEMYLLKWFCTN